MPVNGLWVQFANVVAFRFAPPGVSAKLDLILGKFAIRGETSLISVGRNEVCSWPALPGLEMARARQKPGGCSPAEGAGKMQPACRHSILSKVGIGTKSIFRPALLFPESSHASAQGRFLRSPWRCTSL